MLAFKKKKTDDLNLGINWAAKYPPAGSFTTWDFSAAFEEEMGQPPLHRCDAVDRQIRSPEVAATELGHSFNPLTLMPVEGQIKFFIPQSIAGVSQGKGVAVMS